jgi:replication factor C small subunit
LQLFFTYVSDHKLTEFIKEVAKTEGISISDDGMDALTYYCGGNVAKALVTVQLASIQAKDRQIDQELIYEAVLSETPEDITALFEAAVDNDVISARKIIDKLLIEEGLTGPEILEKLYEVTITSNESEMDIAKAVTKIADIDISMVEGANPRIHLEALISDL